FLFAYTTAANISNQQRASSTMLVSEKLEGLRAASLNSTTWAPGLYSDFVTVAADGTLTASDASAPYLRTWQISAAIPRSATIIVYAQRAGLTRKQLEIARATMVKAW